MSRVDRRRLWGILGLVLFGPSMSSEAAEPAALVKQDYGPDPASVRRHGPAYRYPQSGWIVLHVEGEPYERGYQHGRLMASEIADYLKALAYGRSPSSPGEGWRGVRTLVDALFLRRYDKEYLEEMKGTADGASAAGATFEGRPIDLLDIVAINSDIEVGCLDGALEASANGLEGKVFREPAVGKPKAPQAEHCSAFAAVGPATADGQIVIGHITMWSLPTSRFFNVWLDVKPSQGHRVLMQTYPGGIQSGMDYYQNDVGLVVVETTIGQTKFDADGQPLASRIRKALQYGESIDSVVAILSKKNNGLYSNEWLLADTKTNEIAMFELGTRKTKLWRSSKKEWFGGSEGFYWGCNNAKDVDVRLETVASVEAKPVNLVWRPSDRDRAWLSLFNDQKGKINADFGFKAFTTPPPVLRLVARRQVHHLGDGQGPQELGAVRPADGAGLGTVRTRAEHPRDQAAGLQRLDDADGRGPRLGPRRRQGRRGPQRPGPSRGRPGPRVTLPRLARHRPAEGRRRRLARRRVRGLRGGRLAREGPSVSRPARRKAPGGTGSTWPSTARGPATSRRPGGSARTCRSRRSGPTWPAPTGTTSPPARACCSWPRSARRWATPNSSR